MTSHHVTVKWQQNYFYMFKLISTVDSLLTNTSVKRTPTVGPSLSRSLLLVDSVCNTRLLCAALNVSWRDYISNKELYGDLSPISKVSRYVGCSLVATVGEARMRLFPNYFFGIQNTLDPEGVLSNNIYWSTREWQQSFEAGSCICHGHQKGMGQTW